MPRFHAIVRPAIALACLFVVASAAGAEEPITLVSLLDEMIDRDASARFPEPAYTCRQASSYDRASVSPEEKETWMANNDRSFFLRSETSEGREEWVMMDAEGPGAIVRWWITAADPKGTIRIYLDSQKDPAIEAPARDLIGGKALVEPPLSEVRARGYNLYLPIPYAKHCKVTYDRPNFQVSKKREDLLYYQINYRTYAPGTKVQSYSEDGLKAAANKIASLQEALLAADRAVKPGESHAKPPAATLKDRGDTLSVESKEKGSGAIRRLSVRLQAEDLEAACRQVVLSMSFDGQRTVWCPVGDFFGSGVGVNPFKGWWREVGKDGRMTCSWVMPYRESYEIRLEQFGDEPVKASMEIVTGEWEWDDRSMYFHCGWRQEHPIDTTTKHDWNYVTIEGRGVYMGDTLCVVNPVPAWWGEGDEKIYVDGEKFPSHFGTGTEDYYGYAWCTPEFFQAPFHAQPRAQGPRNFGHTTNTRVRMLDAIPFQKRLQMDMEVWHWAQVEVAYAVATYWYALPGAESNRGPAPDDLNVITPVPPKPPKVEGAIEGEGLKILEKTGGKTEVQSIPAFKWSNNAQLWWIDGKPGDKLVLAVPVEKAGTYQLTARLTKAIDYGIVRLSLDGQALGEPIDLFNDGVIGQTCKLGKHELSAGERKLTVEITGANEKAVKRHMFGLDYLKLDPAN